MERSARLALIGQSLAAGVVSGLEIVLEPSTGAGVPAAIRVQPGLGLASSGEVLTVTSPMRVAVPDLPVLADAATLAKAGFGVSPPPANPPDHAVARLRDLTEAQFDLPHAGVLVLRPVSAEVIGRPDAPGVCPADASADAFADWRYVDGSELALFPWPTDWAGLPAIDDWWRNRLADVIFTRLQAPASGDDPVAGDPVAPPWEAAGVPVGLVGFDANWVPLFVDRHAVARPGGGRCVGRTLVPDAPDPRVGPVRVAQFAEQLAEIATDATSPDQIAAPFRVIPPFGVLPKALVDVRVAGNPPQNHFFPATFALEAAPVPLEQIEDIYRATVGLAPITVVVGDGSAPSESLRVLVPVPQVFYEPALLVQEEPDPEFETEVARLTLRRARWLKRRAMAADNGVAIGLAIRTNPKPQLPARHRRRRGRGRPGRRPDRPGRPGSVAARAGLRRGRTTG